MNVKELKPDHLSRNPNNFKILLLHRHKHYESLLERERNPAKCDQAPAGMSRWS